jgi:hypothetical protein
MHRATISDLGSGAVQRSQNPGYRYVKQDRQWLDLPRIERRSAVNDAGERCLVHTDLPGNPVLAVAALVNDRL